MKILDARGKENAEWALRQLTRRAEPDRKVRTAVERIISEVRKGGDVALVKIHNRFALKKIRRNDLKVKSETMNT